jgi:hypothetical protein
VIDLLVEGELDSIVAGRILVEVGLVVGRPFGRSGRNDFFQRLPRYNQAAQYSRWMALVDLETTQACVPGFVARHLPNPSPYMRFRVAVHAIESWLLADGGALARFLRVQPIRIPQDPDAILRPKVALINIARHSTSAQIRSGLVPRHGSGASQGPQYISLMQDFIVNRWRPRVAAELSPSLARCLAALSDFGEPNAS